MENDPPFSLPRGTKELIAGIFAGISGTIIGHPLDTVKVNEHKGICI
jgi:hypothetical protein